MTEACREKFPWRKPVYNKTPNTLLKEETPKGDSSFASLKLAQVTTNPKSKKQLQSDS